MEHEQHGTIKSKKKIKQTDRAYNCAVFLLRCCQIGISISDLNALTIGLVQDMAIEAQNDNEKYDRVATEEDYMNF